MSISSPPVASRFLSALGSRDADAVIACFTEDASLTDEARTWHGPDEIRRWFATVATAFQYTMEVLAAESSQPAAGLKRHDVRVRLEGNFPGGVVDLTYAFFVRDGRIAELRMAP